MLMLLGGAPRAGKGVISRRCVDAKRLSVLSLDVLKMGLHHAVPSMGVDPNAGSDEVGRRMWPLVRAMGRNVVQSSLDYLFEGDMLLPSQAAELHELYGDEVRSCFIGYANADLDKKFEDIRAHRDLPNDWLNEHSDPYVRDIVAYGIEYSRQLRDECQQFGLTYFEGSQDFEGAVVAAAEHLCGPE